MDLPLFWVIVLSMQWVFISYCIYKIYTNNRVKRITYFLTGDRCCSDRHSHTCANINCRHKVKREIISKISKAKCSIDIAVFHFTHYDIMTELLIAYDRHVDIRIIVDRSMFTNDGSTQRIIRKLLEKGKIFAFCLELCHTVKMLLLLKLGIDVRMLDRRSRLMHHKYCVIDPQSRNGILISGSLNWTKRVSIQEKKQSYVLPLRRSTD